MQCLLDATEKRRKFDLFASLNVISLDITFRMIMYRMFIVSNRYITKVVRPIVLYIAEVSRMASQTN